LKTQTAGVEPAVFLFDESRFIPTDKGFYLSGLYRALLFSPPLDGCDG